MQMCPNGTYSRVCLGKHLSDVFNIRNGLKNEIFIALVFNFLSVWR